MAGDSLSRSEIDGKLQKLENKLDTLRRDYEQFFVGARDRPPRNTRKQVDKLVRDLEQASVTNTSQKFKLRSLVQKYSSYKQKWNRVQRQIEQGTYKPHQDRAKRNMEQKDRAEQREEGGQNDGGDEQQEDEVVELDVDMESVDLGDLEKELEEMDQQGEFDRYEETERLSERDFEEAEQKQKQRRRRPPQQADRSGGSDRTASSGERPGDTSDAPKRRDADEDKLREIQNKLGISSGKGDDSSSKGGGEETREKLKSMRQKLGGDDAGGRSGGGGGTDRQSRRRETGNASKRSSSNAPSGGAKREDLEKLRRAKGKQNNPERSGSRGSDRESNRSDSGGSQRQDRVIERSSNRRRSSRRDSSDEDSDDDDETHAAHLYDRLVATKRAYGEPTDDLTFEAVRESMHRQIDRLVDERDCRDADFRVVVKNEQVYLQPVPIE